MKTYKYHLFLLNPETKHSIVQTIEVDNDGFMDANTLFKKLSNHSDQFEKGYTLIGLNVGLVTGDNKDEC